MRRPGLLALPLLALVVWLQARLDAATSGPPTAREALYLPSGRYARYLFPGFEGVAADVYWLRVVQYFGGYRSLAAQHGMPLLGPLLDITVTLDPRMEMAYRYGATFLAEPAPLGAGRPREAVALLERGVKALPGQWRLRQDIGFITYLHLHDYQRAAQVLLEAADVPGAAYWLRNMAADVLARGGERETARRMWRQIAEQSDGIVKANAQVNIDVLDALDHADRLTGLVGEFEHRRGRRPASLDELRAAGLLRRPAVDSSGVPFVYDPHTGHVTVSRRSVLYRMDRQSP